MMLCEEVKKELWKEDKNYIYEEKFDGERALIYVKDNRIDRLITRRGQSVLAKFPEFKDITFNINKGILDCEICIFSNGRSDFNLLSLRTHLKDEEKIKERINLKAVIMVFDILLFEDIDLTLKPLIKRKEYLNKAVIENDFIKIVKTYDNLEEIWNIVLKNNLEGVIAKHKFSAYENKRSKYWVKIKNWKEIVIEFDGYENAISEDYGVIKGITLTNKDGLRCACLGEKHKKIKEKLDRGEIVRVNCQYLEKTNDNKFRFLTFKEEVGGLENEKDRCY